MKTKTNYRIIPVVLFVIFALSVCVSAGYKPDPSIPRRDLARLKVSDKDLHIVSIDGIATGLNHPKSIRIEAGRHTIEFYSDNIKRVLSPFSVQGGVHIMKIEFEFSKSAAYELCYESESVKSVSLSETVTVTSRTPGIRRAER